MLSASVTVEKQLVSSIGRGVLVFAAVAPGDTEKEADSLANKVVKMKLWDDEEGVGVSEAFCPGCETPANHLSRGDSGKEVSQTLRARYSVVSNNTYFLPGANNRRLIWLLVSQFTLLAKTKKGTKPDFHGAAKPEEASRLYHYFVQKVKDLYLADRVKDGKFQAMMEVALVNDGPVCHDALRLFDNAKSVLISCLYYTGYSGAPGWCFRV